MRIGAVATTAPASSSGKSCRSTTASERKPERHREHPLVEDEDQRVEEVAPRDGEREHRHGDRHGPDERHRHVPPRRVRAHPFEPGRLEELLRQPAEAPVEEQDVERRRADQRRRDQRPVRVEHPQVLEHHEPRDEQRGDGHHQRDERRRDQAGRSPPRHARHREPRPGRDEHGQRDRDRDDVERVERVPGDVDLVERPRVVVEGERRRARARASSAAAGRPCAASRRS